MIELISFLVPVAFGIIALILILLLVFHASKQQKQTTPIRKSQTRISTATRQPKSIQDSNQIGYGVAANVVANLLATYFRHIGMPTGQAYTYAYCGAIVLGILILLPFHLESQLLDENQHNQNSSSSTLPKQTPLLTNHHPLKVQLLAMVGGHHPTADRLLNQVMRENPGKTVDWYYDKVIQDLIRDRR